MKIKEIRELADADLKERLKSESITLQQLVINHSTTPLDNPSLIAQKRKTIARLLTEIRAREIKKA